MASLIGKAVGKVSNEIAELEKGRIFQSPLNKVWRALILANRISSPMPKSEAKFKEKLNDAKNKHVALPGSYSESQRKDKWYQNKIQAETSGTPVDKILASKSIDYTTANQIVEELIKNDIVIANLDVSPAVSLVIQNRPDSLRVQPDSAWAVVKSLGRNNPFYFYTGGEDTISFDISWYSNDAENRDDVVNKCRLLESWTRANGYSSSPPTLRIQWGNSGLFEDDLFILASAPYELSHFQNAARMRRFDNDPDTGQRIASTVTRARDLKLLPNCATQSLTFKRVSTKNRTWEDIIPSSKLERTPGIIIDKTSGNSLEDTPTE